MNLSQQNAMKIVTEINSIIDQKINIMNPAGIIIASTDSARIGTFHEVAKKLVDENMEEFIIYSDDEYKGSKNGVNFPLIVLGETVGVLGITGPYEEVSKLGMVVKRMTEILLLESTKKEEQLLEESIKNRFVYDWLNNDSQTLSKDLMNRGKLLGIDITIPRRIMIFSIMGNDSNSMEELRNIDFARQNIRQMINQSHKDNVFLHTAANLVCMVISRSDNELAKLAMDIKNATEDRFHIRVAVGIDSRNDNYKEIHHSFIKANKALVSCSRTHKYDIRFYDDLNMEIFSDDITDAIKMEYIKKIFKGYNDKKIGEAVQVLEAFYEEEGSLTRAAKRLFIHKNTLQYKLRKIQEQTGYDPRSIRYASLFSNAVYFYHDIKDSMIG